MDPYQITPSFVCFPSLDAHAPAPLASTHCRLVVHDAVWCNSPSLASTGPIYICNYGVPAQWTPVLINKNA
jgi:hypothetical protein